MTFVTDSTKRAYRKMFRQCGWWATARCLQKNGYTAQQVRAIFEGTKGK